jgi:thiol-disulfide isomerase/thioredoxin
MRLLNTLRVAILPLPVLWATGCQQSRQPESPGTDAVNAPTAAAPDAVQTASSEPTAIGAPDNVQLDIKSWGEVEQLVAGQKGKVVVVDIWSTWCVECMREFPHLVQLDRDYPQDVVCMSVSIDYAGMKGETPEASREKVLEFLNKQQATFQNVISSDTDLDVLDKLGLASVPAVLVYDREGRLHTQFSNDDNEYGDEGFTYAAHIIPLVQQLIDASPAPGGPGVP